MSFYYFKTYVFDFFKWNSLPPPLLNALYLFEKKMDYLLYIHFPTFRIWPLYIDTILYIKKLGSVKLITVYKMTK